MSCRSFRSQTRYNLRPRKKSVPLSRARLDKVERKYGPVDRYIPRGYRVYKILGKGVFGVVLLVCKTNAPAECRAVKVQAVRKGKRREIKNEVRMHKKFARVGLAPKLYGVRYFRYGSREFASIVMGKIDGLLNDFLQERRRSHELLRVFSWVVHVVDKMREFDLTHGDMHTENIGYSVVIRHDKLDVVPTLIDFGWASATPCHPDLELIQYLRTLATDKINIDNRDFLRGLLVDQYRRAYNRKLRDSVRAFDKEWNKLMDDYVDEIEA